MSSAHGIDRRAALGVLGAAGVVAMSATAFARQAAAAVPAPGNAPADARPGWDEATGQYVLPALPYAPEALEPHIDAETMRLHHGKHHQAYVNGLNKAVGELRKIAETGDAALVKHWSRELAFHGGGHVNHTIFWAVMAPPDKGGGGAPQPGTELAAQIDRDFGSFSRFSALFQASAVAVEASGWAWLVWDHVSRRLMVQQMERQQDLLMTYASPIMGADVWEHAYYLRYQNRRADYVKAFMNVINWPVVDRIFATVRGAR
ncbi:MAG: superoxide dismutase [Phycisphaerales bacterium]|nr:superoxide dismutase [Phycisphaerales bacterium]